MYELYYMALSFISHACTAKLSRPLCERWERRKNPIIPKCRKSYNYLYEIIISYRANLYLKKEFFWVLAVMWGQINFFHFISFFDTLNCASAEDFMRLLAMPVRLKEVGVL